MDAFSYLSVLISIVLGLGLAHVLAGAARLLRYRARVRFYGPALAWMAFLFLVHVQIWWAMFDLRDVAMWTFVAFLLVLLIPVLAYFLTFLLVPDTEAGEAVDLRASYYESRPAFFGVLGLLPIASLAMDFVVSERVYADTDVVFRVGFVVLAAVGFFSASERVHRALAFVGPGAFVAYVVLLFLRLA